MTSVCLHGIPQAVVAPLGLRRWGDALDNNRVASILMTLQTTRSLHREANVIKIYLAHLRSRFAGGQVTIGAMH